MPLIDRLLEKMVQGQAESAYLQGDELIKFAYGDGKATGPAVSREQLDRLLNEIIPSNLKTKLEHANKVTFDYDSQHGRFSLDVFQSDSTLTLYIAPTGSAPETADPFGEDWPELTVQPASTPATTRPSHPSPRGPQSPLGARSDYQSTAPIDPYERVPMRTLPGQSNSNVNRSNRSSPGNGGLDEMSPGCSVTLIGVGVLFMWGILGQSGTWSKGELGAFLMGALFVIFGVVGLIGRLTK